MFVEKRESGRGWRAVRPPGGSRRGDWEGWYDGRNYDLFGLLASVRRQPPVAIEAKGLPPDLGRELRGVDWSWMHSHSWLTVQEVLDIPWTQGCDLRGVVPLDEKDMRAFPGFVPSTYRAWLEERRKPEAYSQGVYGPCVQTISEAEARAILEGVAPRDPTVRYHVAMHWPETYAEQCSHFLKMFHEQIVPLGDPTQVRLVFGFDS
jgi:hypothetical protein